MPGLKQTFKSQLGDNDSTNQEDLGAIRYDENKVYKYVKFSGTTAVAVGDFVCYVLSDTTGSTVDGANTALAAGVAMAVAASGSVSYGWVKIKGVATLSTALAGSPAAGDQLSTNGATAPAVTKSTAANFQTAAIALNVTSKIVMVDCPF